MLPSKTKCLSRRSTGMISSRLRVATCRQSASLSMILHLVKYRVHSCSLCSRKSEILRSQASPADVSYVQVSVPACGLLIQWAYTNLSRDSEPPPVLTRKTRDCLGDSRPHYFLPSPRTRINAKVSLPGLVVFKKCRMSRTCAK